MGQYEPAYQLPSRNQGMGNRPAAVYDEMLDHSIRSGIGSVLTTRWLARRFWVYCAPV